MGDDGSGGPELFIDARDRGKHNDPGRGIERACRFVADRAAGLYDMQDVLGFTQSLR